LCRKTKRNYLPRFESPSPRNGWFRRNRAFPTKDRESTTVAVSHVDEICIRVLKDLARVSVHSAEGRVFGREVVAHLARQERIGNVPHPNALIVPSIVEEAGRAVVKPRQVARLLTSQALKVTRIKVIDVIDMWYAVAGDALQIRRPIARYNLWILEIGHIDDPAKSRWTRKNLIRVQDKRRMLVAIDNNRCRGVGRAE
jgi:hypothetical protein